MHRERAARTTVIVVGILAIPLAVASIAFACARLATLKLDRASAGRGTEVTAVGRNFNGDAKSSPVAVRFNSRNGRVLWEGRADRQGKFKATFKAPSARTGDYVILATQTTAEGRPAAGTPGRAPLRIRSGSSSSAAAPLAPPGGNGLPAVPVAPLAVTLLLLGSGALVVTAGRRRATGSTRR